MYFKLALGNVRKSIRDYGIYFLTLVFGVCVFYAFNSITQQSAVLDMGETQSRLLDFLSTLIGGVSVFIAVILGFLIVYASRYLIRRRKKEFGTYLTLGMPPSKVSRIIVYETLFVGIISLIVGIIAGLLLSQALLYITAALFTVKMDMFVFVFSFEALLNTILCFGIIFVVALIFNVFSVSRYRLIDLINADRKNEGMKIRSIPLSVVIFLISLFLIGIAYALLLDNGLVEFDEQFALSTILVCIGTFLLFFSVSGFLLRAVQSNKGLYFRGLNMFTLRQLNAKINTAFTSITLVCMALFLAITATCGGFSLCTAFTQNLERTTQYDASLTASYEGYSVLAEEDAPWYGLAQADNFDMRSALERDVTTWKDVVDASTQVDFYESDASVKYVHDRSDGQINSSVNADNLDEVFLDVVPVSDFNALREMNGLEPLTLASDEYVLWVDFEELYDLYDSFVERGESLPVYGVTLQPKLHETDHMLTATSALAMNTGAIVVPDEVIPEDTKLKHSILNIMYKGEREQLEPQFIDALDTTYWEKWNLDSSEIGWPFSGYLTAVEAYDQSNGLSVTIAYLAIYIGFVLLIACAAILALQQLSEAADNVNRYQLLEKLGADTKMINKALFTQIGIYFVFPLVVAFAHSFVALKVVVEAVMMYGHLDIAGPLAVTLALFVLVYGGYFLLTYFASQSMIHAEKKS
ncbi:MAG: FtsX-like permease family protein [Raoultibacter sp.]|jgi:putative ABC transport system permease protein